MIRSTADKDAKQKALADMQARRAKLAARQAQLDDDEHIDSASAGLALNLLLLLWVVQAGDLQRAALSVATVVLFFAGSAA